MADDFDINRIDEVIHGRIRLGIMAYLAGAERADFNTLKARLQTTDGNLSVHLREAGGRRLYRGQQELQRAQAADRGGHDGGGTRRLCRLSRRHGGVDAVRLRRG